MPDHAKNVFKKKKGIIIPENEIDNDPVISFYLNCFFMLSTERQVEHGQIPHSKIVWFKHYYEIYDRFFIKLMQALDNKFLKLRSDKIKKDSAKKSNKNKLLNKR